MKIKFTIKTWRRLANLSQEQLAQKLGVTKQTVFNWEKGTHKPHKHTLQAMADIYGIEVSEIEFD